MIKKYLFILHVSLNVIMTIYHLAIKKITATGFQGAREFSSFFFFNFLFRVTLKNNLPIEKQWPVLDDFLISFNWYSRRHSACIDAYYSRGAVNCTRGTRRFCRIIWKKKKIVFSSFLLYRYTCASACTYHFNFLCLKKCNFLVTVTARS